VGDNLFKVLITSAKAKITPLVTKIKLWTSWNFIRTRLISKIRDFFSSLLNVRPRHKKDYYEVFGWLISRRLAIALVVVVGVISLWYLFSVHSVLPSAKAESVKTYDYDSVLLRFAEEKVRILGSSGYLAYEGQVEKGSVTGYGTLYNPQGVIVYQGNFVKNCYQGRGTRYYDDGTVMYVGEFEQNLFHGSGKLYRENGSLAYDGEFSLGKKEGEGRLYDAGGNPVYTGAFSQDALLYSALLGKKLSEVAEAYQGKRTLYEYDREYAVVLEDIGAVYSGAGEPDTLAGERTVEQVLVLEDFFRGGDRVCTEIGELRDYFGEEDYAGNAAVTFPEAVAVERVVSRGTGIGFRREVEMEVTSEYGDYYQVEGYDTDYTVYLYSFHKDGLIYNFICQDREAGFSFYTIERMGEGAV
jgi:hypothetical protein